LAREFFLYFLRPGYNADVAERELLTKAETMEYLRLSRGALDRLMRARAIRYIKIGKKVIFRQKDIEAFLEKRVVK